MGNAEALGIRVNMITLSYPKDFSNEKRNQLNTEMRKRIRMKFKGGIWWTEQHTGKSYKDYKGNWNNGDQEMVGMIHYHYKFMSDLSIYSLLKWLKKWQIKDKVENNSYHLSKRSESDLYSHAYSQAKLDQQDFESKNILWSSWGLDKRPMNTWDMKDIYPYELKTHSFRTKSITIMKKIYDYNNPKDGSNSQQ